MYYSKFAPDIENMLASLHNCGLQMDYINFFLHDFDLFCVNVYPDISLLVLEAAEAWIHNTESKSAVHMSRRVRTMKHLGEYQRSLGKTAYIPDYAIKCPPAEEPHLFSDGQLTEFFEKVDTEVAATETFPYNDIVLPILFRLIYCCGLRSSEACNLTVDDVDFMDGTLTVYRGKGFRDRMVFMGHDIWDLCLRFDTFYSRILPGRVYFFQPDKGKSCYKSYQIGGFFDALLKKTSFRHAQGKKFTPHGLRHLFAVQNIRKCADSEDDFMNWIQYLCKYMGHTHIRDTMYYLHITSQLFPVYREKLYLLEEKVGVVYAEE